MAVCEWCVREALCLPDGCAERIEWRSGEVADGSASASLLIVVSIFFIQEAFAFECSNFDERLG
jgi:hypothetical protein